MSDNRAWTIDRLISDLNKWDCHQSDECECPHRYCDTLCSGKAADQCQVELPPELEDGPDDVDVPGCCPETCGQAQLEAILVALQALLQVPSNRELANEALQKHFADGAT